ncbi:minor coat protein [bacterium 19CA06SA08-2]|uniref:Minor coat protein n=1 Tax=bacterium 19CA06SA08-2 TaxID=2920658 RepID=A0AAU6U1W7_UNCXX
MGGIGKAIAALLVSLGGPILNAILDIFKQGALRRVAAWVTLIAMMGTLFLGVNGLIGGFKMLMPTWMEIGMSWIIPNNFSVCITTYLAGSALITLYKWHRRGIQLALGF